MEIVLKDVIRDFLRRNAKHNIECDDANKILDDKFVEVKITETYFASKDGQTGFIQRYKFNKYEYMIGKIEYLYDIRSIARNEYLKLCSEYREIVKNVSLEKKFPYEEFLQKKIEEYKNHYEFIDEYTYIDAFPINKYMDIKNLPQLKKQNRAKYREVDESLLRNYHNKIIEKYGASYAVETKRYFENKLNELNKNKYIDLAAEKSDKEKEVINAKYIVKANNITRIIDALNKHIETLRNYKLNKSIEKI